MPGYSKSLSLDIQEKNIVALQFFCCITFIWSITNALFFFLVFESLASLGYVFLFYSLRDQWPGLSNMVFYF